MGVTESVTPKVTDLALQCYICGLEIKIKANESNQIVSHIKNEHNFHWNLVLKNNYDSTIRYSMYGAPRPHQCPECKLMFKSEEDLKLHICGQIPPFWLNGIGKNDNPCPKCDKNFNTYGKLLFHYATVHTKVRNFACEFCDFTAFHPDHVRGHVRTWYKVGDFKCDFQCESKFNLRNHKLSSHVKKPMTKTKVMNFEVDESTIHECEKCILGFPNQKDFMAHLKSDHAKPKKSKETSIEESPIKKARNELYSDLQMDVTSEFRCDYCDKEFVTQQTLHSHIKSHFS